MMDSDFLRLSRRVKELETIRPQAAAPRITGEMLLWPGGTAPEGWLLCDGAAVSRTDYAALFAVIGTIYGAGDGSTTFNLPNLRGRVPVGLDAADGSFNFLGETGGEKAHALTVGEMPAHSHTINSAGAHTHQIYGVNSRVSGTWNGYVGSADCGPSSNNNALSAGGHVHVANSAGDNGAHNSMPPYVALNYIVKT